MTILAQKFHQFCLNMRNPISNNAQRNEFEKEFEKSVMGKLMNETTKEIQHYKAQAQ